MSIEELYLYHNYIKSCWSILALDLKRNIPLELFFLELIIVFLKKYHTSLSLVVVHVKYNMNIFSAISQGRQQMRDFLQFALVIPTLIKK